MHFCFQGKNRTFVLLTVFSVILSYRWLTISILLMALTENFQQPLIAPGTVITELTTLTINKIIKGEVYSINCVFKSLMQF